MRSIGKPGLLTSGMLMLLVLLAGCKTTPLTGTSDICLIWKPITYSAKNDSADTVEEIRNQNARREAYCAG